jgi:hypothetical protein
MAKTDSPTHPAGTFSNRTFAQKLGMGEIQFNRKFCAIDKQKLERFCFLVLMDVDEELLN